MKTSSRRRVKTYNWPEKWGEWQRAITRESPCLPGRSNEDGNTHEVLHNKEKHNESHGTMLAESVVVNLGHLKHARMRGQGQQIRLAGVLLSRSDILTGCPYELPSTLSISGFIQAASTMVMKKPRPQHMPIELRMPRGTALAALLASSDM